VKELSPAVEPLSREVLFDRFKAEIDIRISLPNDDPPVLSVDIYSFQPQVHPDTHLGFWHFRLEKGEHLLRFRFDFSTIGDASLRAFAGSREIAPEHHWVNPDYRVTLLQDCKFVFWTKDDQILLLKRILLQVRDPEILRAFYDRQFATEGYHPEAPFLDRLYHYKLRILKKYFGRYYRGRVLDIGCGLCLFTKIGKSWDFQIVAGDLVPAQVLERKKERADICWTAFDAAAPPFKPGSFDGLFAGEILEHLPRPEEALWEWNRVLKPGGTLILTTPNRERRTNMLNRENWPYSPDHLREFGFAELNREMLPRAGFKPIKKKGIYLELWTRSNRWWFEDYLQREGNTLRNLTFMKVLYRAGFIFPRRSLDLITVAKKIDSGPAGN
jgi:SAM-dependent methyltransferase